MGWPTLSAGNQSRERAAFRHEFACEPEPVRQPQGEYGYGDGMRRICVPGTQLTGWLIVKRMRRDMHAEPCMADQYDRQ
jgi:hypothetical protein